MSVGQELLDVPFPEMVASLGQGIADAQHQLDMNSVEVAEKLANTEIEVVPAITRTIGSDGEVTYDSAEAVDVSLLQAGMFPTFYQFSEATIDVEMDIKTTTERETNIDVSAKARAGFGLWGASVQTDVSHNRKFGKEVHGTSRLRTTMVPVPAPPYLFPEVETVDNRPTDE
ncbi:hypothetical protein GRS48_02315 [Halorubrum sp. JWXQ-INN 858]|uniref:hypothetical protein n=1 Tax=Halorubrum sp. JWXQ-INN 858 TaxID=2690782 RepID=UPI001358C84B|nr:hypothetical protein [Halorubrum sp. JWXQ-INN 858]MWV63662.1 hypothetical protein [Halorubrum sp. JWXQ-INN 858]